MCALLCLILAVLALPFKSKSRLEAENAALRHQLIVLRRKVHGRVRLTNNDRWFFIQLYRWFPSILTVLTIIRAETLVRWHRAGFRRYWRWKSRPLGGRPQIENDLRALIRRISQPAFSTKVLDFDGTRAFWLFRFHEIGSAIAHTSGALQIRSAGISPKRVPISHRWRSHLWHRRVTTGLSIYSRSAA
jgi:hypothetical protein